MKKNYWAMSIFIFLALCVCAIIASVIFALSHPVREDRTYFSTKQDIDQQINTILKNQKQFDKECKLYVDANQIPQIQDDLRVFNPYVEPRLRPALNFKAKTAQKIYLSLDCLQPQSLTISAFLEKINASDTIQALGELKENQGVFESQEFVIDSVGRYKVIFEVLDAKKQRKLFFQREVFFK